jgi:hypothetical protein
VGFVNSTGTVAKAKQARSPRLGWGGNGTEKGRRVAGCDPCAEAPKSKVERDRASAAAVARGSSGHFRCWLLERRVDVAGSRPVPGRPSQIERVSSSSTGLTGIVGSLQALDSNGT